ncbi:hypothetical protein PVAND_007259 [Polypedilum vanderplanki]|uniref:Uncharacterized protein n=1 Tax=Polypedilum vanderplanki TaxID=319348 RepID=A0A9J6C698_POLVA|nr:hypothetical protein PVAND_007259 [Polypedilum vanderplanki]
MTPEPEVSIDVRESSIEKELLNVGGDSLRRTKRCINSLDRSASRSSSRLSRRSKKSKSPSVASEEDYKEWFEKFDNHLSSELTLPENDDDDDEAFDSDMEEELLMDADIGNLDGAEICNIDEDRDVSVSITLNLKQKQPKQQQDENECHPCKEFQEPKVFQTKAEEIEEMQKQWETKGRRRLSILPSTDEQQKNYVSMLHPEEFPASIEQREPHQHHEHLHNVGYSEWMKKMVDHHSCHLALDDSESDSDVPLDEVQMLPLFCDEQEAKKKQNRRRKK